MQQVQQLLRRLWRTTPPRINRTYSQLLLEAAAWQSTSASLPRPLRFVTRAVQCYHRIGWRADGEAWQDWCIEQYGWTLTEQAFAVLELNPLPPWEVPGAYTDLAQDCIFRAMQELQESDSHASRTGGEESQVESLLRQWRECADAGGREERLDTHTEAQTRSRKPTIPGDEYSID